MNINLFVKLRPLILVTIYSIFFISFNLSIRAYWTQKSKARMWEKTKVCWYYEKKCILFNHYTKEMTRTITTLETTSIYKENNYKLINVKDVICKFHVGVLRWNYFDLCFDLLIKSELPFRALRAFGVIPNFISSPI